MAKIDIAGCIELVQNEIRLVTSAFKEKGGQRFSRALALAVGLPLAAYTLVLVPAGSKLGRLAGELQVARVTARHADTYKELKDRLSAAYTQLPLPTDRGSWLSDTVREALRAEGLVATQFLPPVDEEANGIVVQNLTIMTSGRFPELMAFLARLESIKPLVHVSAFDIIKRDTQIGRNDATVSISTVIPMERY